MVGFALFAMFFGALTATVGDYFSNITKERLSYKAICAATVLFSGVFATVGVTRIVQIAVPLLVLVYPMAICLIILTIAGRKSIHRAVYIGAVAGTLSTSVFEALTAAGLPVVAANNLITHIPLAKSGFPWILPALAGGVIGTIVALRGKNTLSLDGEGRGEGDYEISPLPFLIISPQLGGSGEEGGLQPSREGRGLFLIIIY